MTYINQYYIINSRPLKPAFRPGVFRRGLKPCPDTALVDQGIAMAIEIEDSGFRIRDAQVEAGTEEFSLKERRTFFGEKQSHQLIENTRWRPRIEQNIPISHRFVGRKG